MREFTMQDLRRILEQSSGESDEVDWDSEETVDQPFDEIGYDSLALLEVAARVQQEFGVRVPDEAINDMKTPRSALAYINNRMAEV